MASQLESQLAWLVIASHQLGKVVRPYTIFSEANGLLISVRMLLIKCLSCLEMSSLLFSILSALGVMPLVLLSDCFCVFVVSHCLIHGRCGVAEKRSSLPQCSGPALGTPSLRSAS